MKKILITLTTVLVMILAFGTVASAKNVINKDIGMSFTIPDSYEIEFSSSEVSHDASIVIKKGRVGVNIMAVSNPDAYFEGFVADDVLTSLLEGMMSTERLSEMLMYGDAYFQKKDVYTTNIGDTKFFVFDGTYNTSGSNVYSEGLYITAYSWAKNGRVYYMEYFRFGNELDTFRPEDFLRNIDYDIGAIKIFVNGNRIYPDTAPAAISGRILVPIRAVAEAMDYEVDWDPKDQLVALKPQYGSGNMVFFGIGYSDYIINGETHYLDVPAIAVNGRTYIPLRAAVESIGGTVYWDGDTNTAYIDC